MKFNLALLTIFTATIVVPRAKATPVCLSTTNCTFDLNDTNVGAFGAGPFGTVNLALSGSAITFTIDLADGFNLIDSGSHEAFTFNNTLGGAVTISDFSSALYSQNLGAGPFHNSPFSDFGDAVTSTCTNGGGCGVNTLSLTVTRTGGFTDVNQLVALSTGNGTAAYFAADIANAAGSTGVVGATGPGTSVTPEPVSSALVGMGLVSLSLFVRRKRAI